MLERTDEKKFQPKEKTYSDQTGKFPHMSTRGNQYVFTMYDYDANAILLEPLISKQSKEIAEVFTTCHNRLTLHGHKITLHILDNECGEYLKLASTRHKLNMNWFHRICIEEMLQSAPFARQKIIYQPA